MNNDVKWLNVHCVDDLGKYVNTKTERHLKFFVKYSNSTDTIEWNDTLPINVELSSSNVSSELVSIVNKYCLAYANTKVGGSNYSASFFVGISSSDDDYLTSVKKIYYCNCAITYNQGWTITNNISEQTYS